MGVLAAALGVATTGPAPTSAIDAASGTRELAAAPTGFASVNTMDQNGTTGGAGGETVTVDTPDELVEYASAEEPYTIEVSGSITVDTEDHMVRVASDKTIIGAADGGEIVDGGFFLDGSHNVIIRNLTIRDSFVEGDWEGKTNDIDGVRMDGAHHVWIDHNRLARLGDGMIDSRMDTSYVTVSWNEMAEHNKVLGIGWTDNVSARLTVHHNWFRDVHQRNPSGDNADALHMFNNYYTNIDGYGSHARGRTRMVLENSYFDRVNDPFYHDDGAQLVERGNIVANSTGRQESRGEAFDPGAFYDYQLDAAEDVPRIVREGSGPLSEPSRTDGGS